MENNRIDISAKSAEFKCKANEYTFFNSGPYWHLCTHGEKQEIIFKNREDFKFGLNSMSASLAEMKLYGKKVKLFAFAIMSNHIHELLCGSREDCIYCFNRWKEKLRRHFSGKVDFSKFECQLIAIESLKSFKNEVAYINRNGYVNNSSETPFSYEWSSGRYYFNPAAKEYSVTPVHKKSYRAKRRIFRSRILDIYNDLEVCKDYVYPPSFCKIKDGESMFFSAHEYFHCISRANEAYGLIAKALGDRIFLSDEEMFSVVRRKCKESYGESSPKLLAADAKIEMAKMMHNEYNASNGQIRRILNIEMAIIDNLFPKIL